MRHVIIGNSFAAVFAAEAIRANAPDDEIVVISKEPQHTYSRAMIHEYLSGLVEEPLVYLREPSYYDDLGVETLLGQDAVRRCGRRVYAVPHLVGGEYCRVLAVSKDNDIAVGRSE